MGWQDAPLVNQPPASSDGKQPSWMNAPVVNAPANASGSTTTTSSTGGQSAQPTWTDTLLQHLAAGSPWDPNAPKKTLATTPFWAKPADVSWGDYAAAHFQPLDDTVRAAANTFGGDRFAAMMDRLTNTGPTSTELVNRVATGQPTDMLSIERARSAAAAQRDPSATAAGNVLGGTMLAQPLGEVAQGGRAIGTAAGVPGWLASRFAGGTVGAGAAAASAADRGENITMPTLIGGGLGAIVGAPTGALAPVARSVEEAQNAESAAYFPTHSIKFPMTEVSDAYHDAQGALSKDQEAGLSSGFKSLLDEHLEQNEKTATTSASEIDGFKRGLDEAATTKADGVLANGVKENLDNVLKNTKPVTPTGDPDPNFATGEAADLLAKAKLAASQRMNAEQIAEARRVGGLPGESLGETGSGWARGALKADPQFYTDPDVNAAMRSVAGAGSWLPPSYLFKHALAYPVAGALAGGVHGYATGGDNPWAHAGQEALEVGGAGALTSYGLPAFRSLLTSQALKGAAPTLTAGAPFPPGQPILDEVRNIIYGRSAAGFKP